MKKMWIALLLALVSGGAWAEWVKAAESDTGTIYIDPTTIRKNGAFVRVWQVHDLKVRHKDGGLSSRALAEYDCKEGRSRPLSISSHSGPMLSGDILATHNYSAVEWSYTPPNTIAESIQRIVCR